MIKARLKTDLRGLARLEKRVPEQTLGGVRAAANALVNDIRSSWSPHSPSDPGNPPAVVTGDLSANIRVDARDRLGRFATDADALSAVIVFEQEYAPYLEESTKKMRPRPFIDPAVQRLEGVYATFFQELFR